jgi:taurine dioxygenase
MRHPVTGHKSLYGVGQSPFAIDSVPDEVARQLLWDLREHCIQPRFRYHHKYQVGDLVIFDSYSTLHAATRIGIAESAKDENARLNWRISVRGLPGVHRHLAA